MVLRFLAALVWLLAAATQYAAQAAPVRVASVNLCTDQLAMLLAAPGQLASVSAWAARPEASNMADEAAALHLNGGSAEEVFALAPDLVLAGDFTRADSVALMRRLGLRVEVFPFARRLEDIPRQLTRMGALLGRERAAAAAVSAFEAALAQARARAAQAPARAAAYYYPNNYTSGADTLADAVLRAAGLQNAAAAMGLSGAARLPLESLVRAAPMVIETRHISAGRRGRAYESLAHPALAALRAQGGAVIEERWQVCGAPFVTAAIDALIAARAPAPLASAPARP